jgi:hypothetical protein
MLYEWQQNYRGFFKPSDIADREYKVYNSTKTHVDAIISFSAM